MSSAVTTTCCGLAIVVGLQLPGAPPPPSSAVQGGPAVPSYDVAWRQPIESTGVLELQPAQQVLLVSGPSSPVEARSLTDGRVLWKAELPSTAAPAVSGSLVFTADGQGLQAIAIDTGTRVWSLPLDRPVTQIAAAGDYVVAVGLAIGTFEPASAWVRCLQARDGRQVWAATLDAPGAMRPVLDTTSVYFSPLDGTLAARDLATGAERWRVPLEVPPGDLTAGRGRLFVRGQARGLFALHADSGFEAWALRRAIAIGKPALDGDRVYVALLEHTVEALDARRGGLDWKAQLPGRPFTGPRVLGETVFVPLVSGEVAAVDRQSGTVTKRDPAIANVRAFQAFAATPDAEWVFALMTEFGSARTLSALRRRH